MAGKDTKHEGLGDAAMRQVQEHLAPTVTESQARSLIEAAVPPPAPAFEEQQGPQIRGHTNPPADVRLSPEKALKDALRNAPKTIVNYEFAEILAREPATYTDTDRMHLERQLRCLVKIDGGWRKGLTDKAKKLGELLCAKLGRDPAKPLWDHAIVIPGMIRR